MPSSLPTREEVGGQLTGALRSLFRADSPETIHARSHAVQAVTGALLALPVEEARRPEAPEGETETGFSSGDPVIVQLRGTGRVWPEGVHTRAGEVLKAGPAGGWLVQIEESIPECADDGVWFDSNVVTASDSEIVAAPPSVPVSTERTDGEPWEEGPNADLIEAVSTKLGMYPAGWDNVNADAVANAFREALAVPASLPPLTDADVERAAQAAHAEWRLFAPGPVDEWGDLPEEVRAGNRRITRAALTASGLYATPREKG